MIKLHETRGVLIFVLGSAILLMYACSTTQPMAVEDTIEQRAVARWDALLGDDLTGAYEYLSPGYRSSVSSKQYQRSLLLKKVKWTSAEYIASDCTETICKVTISLGYTVYGAVPGVRAFKGTEKVEESWLRIDGNWYLAPKQ